MIDGNVHLPEDLHSIIAKYSDDYDASDDDRRDGALGLFGTRLGDDLRAWLATVRQRSWTMTSIHPFTHIVAASFFLQFRCCLVLRLLTVSGTAGRPFLQHKRPLLWADRTDGPMLIDPVVAAALGKSFSPFTRITAADIALFEHAWAAGVPPLTPPGVNPENGSNFDMLAAKAGQHLHFHWQSWTNKAACAAIEAAVKAHCLSLLFRRQFTAFHCPFAASSLPFPAGAAAGRQQLDRHDRCIGGRWGWPVCLLDRSSPADPALLGVHERWHLRPSNSAECRPGGLQQRGAVRRAVRALLALRPRHRLRDNQQYRSPTLPTELSGTVRARLLPPECGRHARTDDVRAGVSGRRGVRGYVPGRRLGQGLDVWSVVSPRAAAPSSDIMMIDGDDDDGDGDGDDDGDVA